MEPETCLWKECDNEINFETYAGRPRVFCSDTCKKRYYREQRKEQEVAFQMSIAEEISTHKMGKCKACDGDFVSKRKDQIFCSKGCKINYHNAKRKEAVVQEKKYVNICRYSGERFETDIETAKFANKNFSNMFHKQQRLFEFVTTDEVFEGNDFSGDTEMINEIFIDCDFEEVNFHKKDLTRVRFIRCRFTDCDFRWTIFQGVDLIECQFFGVNDFSNARVALTKFPSGFESEIYIKEAFTKAQVQSHKLRSLFTQKCREKLIRAMKG